MTTYEGTVQSAQRARISRRSLLRGVAAAGATTALGALLAACGGSSSGAATTAPKPTGGTTTGTTAPAATTGGTTQSADAVKKGGTIKAEIQGDVANLDPLASSLLYDRQVHYNMYDSLVAIDTNLNIIPALAEKWETPDPKTYIFHLRQGVKYHDGTDFNADSVKWNIERYLNNKDSRRKGEIDTIQSVEVMDPSTVKFNLKAPSAPLLSNLVDRAGMMISQKAAEAGGADFTRKPLGAGTGAFKFVEWVKDDHITLERNPNYWKKDASGAPLPYLDKVTIRPIVDETVALTNLKTGDVDISHYVPAKDFETIKAGKEIILRDTPALGYTSFTLNCQAEPFNKKELRQAVAEAIDRDQILKTVYSNVGKVGYGPIPPPSFAADPTFMPYSASTAKAKEYLKAGGKPDGFTFEMLITAGTPIQSQLSQLMKDQLAKAGITLNIVQMDFPTVQANTQAGKFQASLSGWSGRIDPDGNIYNMLHTGASMNDAKYANPQVDDLIEKARAASDQAQRKQFYQQAQKLIVDDAPLVYFQFPISVMLNRPNVQGMQLYADGILRFEGGWLK